MNVVVVGGHGQIALRLLGRRGAVKLIEAAKAGGVSRYVIVSSIGANVPDAAEGGFRAYLQAKADADEVLASSGLDHTIVRPGSLTDEAGTGRIRIETERRDLRAVRRRHPGRRGGRGSVAGPRRYLRRPRAKSSTLILPVSLSS